MIVKAYKLSSFAKTKNGGNPAGVVLDADMLQEELMKLLAKTIGFSETAFVTNSEAADYKVRFFTPNAEVDLCGHATIATFSLLKQKGLAKPGSYTQETKAGILRIAIGEENVFMEQAKPEFFETIPKEEFMECLNINVDDFDSRLPIQIVSTGVRDILVPVGSMSILKALKPDMKKIEEISVKYNVTGLHVFTLSDTPNKAAVCRNFAPLYGIPEESATGTSNGALVSFLYRYGYLKDNLENISIQQGDFMNRPSIIKAMLKVEGDEIKEVWVGGEALITGEDRYEI